MSDISEEQIQELKEAVRESREFESVFVFGSYAKGTSDENSDMDIGVVFRDSDLPNNWSDRLFEIEMNLAKSEVSFPELDFEVFSDDNKEFCQKIGRDEYILLHGKEIKEIF